MRLRMLLELVLLGALWGPSFLFIKVAVTELSPLGLVAARIGIAAATMYILLRIRELKLPRSPKIWGHLAVLGLLANSLPFVLFAYAEMNVDSAVAGIINGATPICAVVLAHFFLSNERINLSRLMGVILGLTGFLLLLLPALFHQHIETDAWGLAMLGLASFSYAAGMVYGRRYLSHLLPLVAPTAWLILASAYMIPLYLIFEFTPSTFTLPAWSVTLSVLGLSLLGTVAAFVLYYRILKRDGATYLAMSNYLLPLFATLLGVLFMGEQLHWTAYVAGVLILLGMMVANGTIRFGSVAKPTPAAEEVTLEPPSRNGNS